MEENPAPVDQPITPPVPDVPVMHEIPKKSKSPAVLIGLLILGLLLAVGYLFYQNNQLKEELELIEFGNTSNMEDQSSQNQLANVTPAPDPTAGWETYANEIHSFRYPPEWEISTTLEIPETVSMSVHNPEATAGIMFTNFRPGFGWGGPSNPVEETPIQVELDGNQYQVTESTDQSGGLGLIVFDIDNGYTVVAGSMSIIPGVTATTSYKEYVNNKSTILQILSTFEFVDEGDPVAGWEVYTSKPYNYRFRHPDLIINPCSIGGLTNDDLLDVVVGKGSQSTMHSCGDDYSVAVFVDKNANLSSVDVKISSYKNYVLETYGEKFEIIQSPSRVGNYDATKLVIRPDQYSLLFAQNPASPLFTITVRSTTDQKEIDQILSTFEFIK